MAIPTGKPPDLCNPKMSRHEAKLLDDIDGGDRVARRSLVVCRKCRAEIAASSAGATE